MASCTHEEADSRMMLHVADAAKQGKSVMVRTVDSDVIVLCLYVFVLLVTTLSSLWVAFGTGKKFRYVAVHEIYAALGQEKCLALPVFHALTDCDTVSSFSGKGKRSAWETWMAYPEVTETFLALMKGSELVDVDAKFDTLERFVVLMYDKTSTSASVNETRLHLFARKGRDVNNIPPTRGALIQHVRRAVYQAGHCWSQVCKPIMNLPLPEGWGWTRHGSGKWTVVWSHLPEASKVCAELLHCSCTKGCERRCKCRIAALSCTALCKCEGSC